MQKKILYKTLYFVFLFNTYDLIRQGPLNDLDRTGLASATTSKQDQQIVSLDEQQTFVITRDIMNQLSWSKIQQTFVEGINHRKLPNEWFKMGAKSQSYQLESSALLRRDNHSSKLHQRIGLELT